jgi:predicted AAA+ superfamily ATPase
MLNRLVNLPEHNSFFIFGARGTGKTYLLKQHPALSKALYFDLLDPELRRELSLNPGSLIERIEACAPFPDWIIIDEVQKAPALLDLVHQQIEKSQRKFVLTGSSARKLKRGAANLLAGRAYVRHLYPLTARELGESFSLASALAWGTLPPVATRTSDSDRSDFLRAYTHTYLKEEITEEQVVRKLDPFSRFLGVAAQMSGQIVNYARIAREAGTNPVSIQSYFQILEDTLIGFLLAPFHESVRKRQRGNPKFYLFDTGVQRAFTRTLSVELAPGTYAFGLAFEHFIVNEIQRLQSYAANDWQLSYLRTKDDVEIDLIIERPGMKRALIEIKSTRNVTEDDIRPLMRIAPQIANSEAFCFSLDPAARKIGPVLCLPWLRGLEEIGL